MLVAQVLHWGALALAAGGACCVAADVRRRRRRELVAAIVALAAMADVALGVRLVPVVWWATAVIATALIAAAGRRDAPVHERTMRATDAVGAILMAALMLAMSATGAAAASVHHGAAMPQLAPLLVAAAAVYAGAAVIVVARMRTRALARIPLVAMNGSVALLAVAALI